MGLDVNNSDEYVIVKDEADNNYEIVEPNGDYSSKQDGIIFDDGSIFKNNNNVNVDVEHNNNVSDQSITDNISGDLLKNINNSIPFRPDKDLSGWYNLNDGSKTGDWDPGELLDLIKKLNEELRKNKQCGP